MADTEAQEFKTWNDKANKLEREYNRLAWRCVCELHSGLTETAVKTAAAAFTSFDEFSKHVASRFPEDSKPVPEPSE